jgi:glycosyltransferase involved in cell wall biosynthesis
MRILVVQETNWPERYPHTQHHLMERLCLRGHEVRVIDYDFDWKRNSQRKVFQARTVFKGVSKIHPNAKIDVVRPSAVNIPLLDYLYLASAEAIEIRRQVGEFKPDIIIGLGILNAYIAARVAQQHSIPFVYYWIDALDTLIPEKMFQALGKFVEQKTIKLSSSVFVTNQKLKDYVVDLGADEKRVSIFSSGIDFQRFNTDVNGLEIRSRYGISSDDTVLLFMGWIYHFSGIKEVVRALAQAREQYPHLKLLLVGEGDAYPEIQSLREELHLEDLVILTGRQPYEKMPEFVAAADICILPAYTDEKTMLDIVPIKVIEYLAGAKPVITTRLPGIMKEFGENSGVVYVDTPDEVLGAAKLLIGTDQSTSIGLRGLRSVKRFDWNIITDLFEEKLANLVGLERDIPMADLFYIERDLDAFQYSSTLKGGELDTSRSSTTHSTMDSDPADPQWGFRN